MTMRLLPLLFLATIIATSHGSERSIPNQIHLLRPQTGSSGHHVPGLSCLSWRLAVETNNIIEWDVVPKECEAYVGHYMLGHQYRLDSRVVTQQAFLYAKSLNLTGVGKAVWVFDIDETTLSTLPYHARPDVGFGALPYNSTAFREWQSEGKAPALPETLKLYKTLLAMGIKVVFLTGRPDTESLRNITATNLKNVGYHTWEKLILKPSYLQGKTAVYYKSSERTKLVKEGYTIVGNMGDQWSDLLGPNPGKRTFKLPDPMYYVG